MDLPKVKENFHI